MNSFCKLLLAAMLFLSCQKERAVLPVATHPPMRYINLADTVVAFNHAASFDLDGNGSKDVLFSTLLVGDPLFQQDKRQWYVSTPFYGSLCVDQQDEIASLSLGDSVRFRPTNGFTWYNASSVLLAQKVIGMSAPPFWSGGWKTANHRFIAVQVATGSGLYQGWVEVSFSTTHEHIVLHGAALCTEANKSIVAGIF